MRRVAEQGAKAQVPKLSTSEEAAGFTSEEAEIGRTEIPPYLLSYDVSYPAPLWLELRSIFFTFQTKKDRVPEETRSGPVTLEVSPDVTIVCGDSCRVK